MGKAGGFLMHKREVPGYRPVQERVSDFKPVELMPDETAIAVQASRCMECGTPFCHGCGCPLSNVIPEINDLVYQGRWRDAYELLQSTSNFPEFTARLCPAPCEAACVLGINDEPVTIRQIEIMVIEKAFAEGYISDKVPVKRMGKKVAVIGAGPAGLVVADVLNKAGVDVMVFDSAQKPGGILRYGIPDFKLDKGIVDRRIDLMKKQGVGFECGVKVGSDISYRYLKDRFDAICMATGAREPRDLNVPGRSLNGIHFAMDYLVRQNRRNAGEQVENNIDAHGKDVVVIGGGDTGSDCVGTAIRQGARRVCQLEIMPRPPEERAPETPWPMWPNMLRSSSSHEEGGERRWSAGTKRFEGRDHVEKVCCVELEWTGSGGRMECREKSGSEFEINAQLVLLAMGFVSVGEAQLVSELGVELNAKGSVRTDERKMTSVRGIFASGDVVTGQSLVVRAMADGRKTAAEIISYLRR